MSCCGQTAVQAQAAAHRTLEERTAAQTHVRLVYIGQDKRVRPFVAAGKVYQFGDNERRRTNVVAQAAVVKLLATGWFAVFDPERYNEDGSAKLTTSGTPKEGQGAGTSLLLPGDPAIGMDAPASPVDKPATKRKGGG